MSIDPKHSTKTIRRNSLLLFIVHGNTNKTGTSNTVPQKPFLFGEERKLHTLVRVYVIRYFYFE